MVNYVSRRSQNNSSVFQLSQFSCGGDCLFECLLSFKFYSSKKLKLLNFSLVTNADVKLLWQSVFNRCTSSAQEEWICLYNRKSCFLTEKFFLCFSVGPAFFRFKKMVLRNPDKVSILFEEKKVWFIYI